MKDALGDRMKAQYENRAKAFLPRRTYTIIRLDGKAFHTYTRGLDRPYDQQLMDDMAATAEFLCREVGGSRLAYCQSDEISLVLTDFDKPSTQAWFDGGVQKITSVSASLATARFNELRPGKLAFFDSRVFTIPDPVEVANYLIWRQQDATRNSISMAAQAVFSHKQLFGKSTGQMQEMLWAERNINWNDYDPRFKRGTVASSKRVLGDVEYVDRRSGETRLAVGVERRVWEISAAPIFTQDRAFLAYQIPGLAPPEESSTAVYEEPMRA
jgi:tRNA(His) guanylyltransferase